MRRSVPLFALLVALVLVACDNDKGTIRNPAGPTPGGDQKATDKLILVFIPPCASTAAITSSKGEMFGGFDLLERLTSRQMLRSSTLRTVDGWRVMELTEDGVETEKVLANRTLAIPNLPTCIRLPPNNFALVVTAENGRLEHAIQLTRELRTDETWSGALLWLYEHTTNYAQVTSIPFVQGSTDRFSFAGVATTGTVDISFRFQPGRPRDREPDQIPILLNLAMMDARGIDRCTVQLIGRDYRVRCDSLPKPI
jgi:hypothetical protein